MNILPDISIIIPCYNEHDYIERCLDSCLKNDYPIEKVEILVVDGMSTDGTREIIMRYAKDHSYIKLIDNLDKITPVALNLGINAAKGEIIIRLDAHTVYEESYFSKCIQYIYEYEADNVGGIINTLPRKDSKIGKSIALSFSHPFGSGNAYYKTGYSDEPKWVDTVPFGCYRREVFEKIGLFDVRLSRSQDMEFNKRLIRSGGRILLVPSIVSKYYVRSDIKSYYLHNYLDGFWSIYPFRFVKEPVSIRHLVPLLFVSSVLMSSALSVFSKLPRRVLLIILCLYSSISLIVSFNIAKKENDCTLLPLCFLSFLIRHIGYGIGSLVAIPRTIFSHEFLRNRIQRYYQNEGIKNAALS